MWRDRRLDLDRSSRGHRRGRNQRRDVARPGGEKSYGGDRSTGPGSPARGDRAATRRAPGTAAEAEDLGDHAHRPNRRRKRGKPAADAAQLAVEVAALGAVVHVAPGRAAGTHAAVVGERELPADVRARCVAGLERLRQRDPGTNQ